MRTLSILSNIVIFSVTSISALKYGQLCDSTPLYRESWQYDDSCDDVYLFCDPASNTCNYKGCSNADYIAGWDTNVREFPARCTGTTFCPDNRSKCEPQVSVGSRCEVQRDDECSGSDSICLNSTCFIKGAPLGGNCGTDISTYTSYDAAGDAIQQTIIRDNCTDGTWCSDFLCIQSKDVNAACDQDRECLSGTCSNNGVCIVGPDVFHKIANWLWGVLATAIVLFVVLILCLLWILHRYQSKQEHAKIVQFFGDNEEFSKYAMLNEDDGSSYHDSDSLRVPTPLSNQQLNDSRHSLVYLTTPDYNTSHSLTIKPKNASSTGLNTMTQNSRASSTHNVSNLFTRSHTPDPQQ
ncbi:hypothetical protein MBANPS3_002697 [Mucor bainieri]